MKKLFVSSSRKLTYVIAICIIIFAVFVSVSYLLTPLVDKHKTDIEKIASDLLQTPVTIHQVEISWYRYHPEITLNAVTILNKESKDPLLQIEKVRVFFSIPQSIWQRKLVPSAVMIQGTDLNLREAANGEISVQGFPALGGANNQPYQKETKIADIMGWLYIQPRLILQNVNVHYTRKTQKRFVTLNNLSFENQGARHIILGKALLHQEIPTEVSLALRWSGNSVDLKQIKAKIYLYISGLSLGQWLKDYNWEHWQITHGIATAKIWGTWHEGAFSKLQSTFQIYGLNLYSDVDKQTHKITRLSGNIGLKQEGNNYTIAGDDLLIDLPNHLWPVNSFYISLMPDIKGALRPKIINLGYVDLQDVQSYLFATNWLSQTLRETLTKLQLKGSLQNVNTLFSGAWDDFRHIALNGNFSEIDFMSVQKYPGMQNLSGTIKWDGTQGGVVFDSHRLMFQDDSIFAKPILLDQLTGAAVFSLDAENTLAATLSSLRILNNDASCELNGKLIFAQNKTPILDLNANFALQQVNHLTRYLPLRVMDADLVKWLKEAFLAGEFSGHMLLKGALADFPFTKGNGEFAVNGTVKNITMHYAPGWPDLSHINGKLQFASNEMLIDVDDAEIFSIPISKVHGTINNFVGTAPQILKVDANPFQIDLTRGLAFIHQSPLQDPLGKMLAGIELRGTSTLKLGLSVPLNDPAKTSATGDIQIKKAEMLLVPWKLALKQLNGALHFTDTTLAAQNIQGQLFNKPFTLNLATKQKDNNTSFLQANLNANLAITDLEHWLKIPFSKTVQGAMDAKVQIDFAEKDPIAITINSNLVGINLDLPDQYAKKSNEARDFTSQIFIAEQGPLKTKIKYGNLFSAALVLNRKKEEFNLTAAGLHLGQGDATWPEGTGLYITGDFDELDWEKIKNYANQSSGKTSLPGLTLRQIDIHTKLLNIMGQRLTDANLEVTPENDKWNINITSPEIAGRIETPQHITTQSLVTAEFQRLTLHSLPESNQSAIDIKSLPAISLSANNVKYNDVPYGQVTFKSTPSNDGMNVQVLRIVSRRMNLQASGWTQQKNTRLNGTLQSTRVSDLLSSFGLSEDSFVAKNGKLSFDLGWHDSLFSPALASLNGRATLDLGAGRLVDVGEAGGAKMDIGRMLSIFSLQSIPRRLSLDFSDIFEKGYSFDSVKADLTFQNGNAYTNNLRIKGPLASVNINGRIGFANKDVDLIISITPAVSSVTSGLPLAAAWIWPVAGLTVLAVNTVIGPAVSKAATYHYAVRGPWGNPNWATVSAAR